MAFASLFIPLHLQQLHLPHCKFPLPTPPFLLPFPPSPPLWSLGSFGWKLLSPAHNQSPPSVARREPEAFFSVSESWINGSNEMPEIQLGAHTLRSHGIKVARTHMNDWIILGLLVVIEVVLNIIEPFHRFVGQEMMTDLRYPLKENTVPIWAVPIIALLIPFAFILAYYCFRKDIYDLHHAILGLLFSVLLTGVITDAIKDAVGRPRPDFFWRCFPYGKGVFDSKTGGAMCTGVSSIIKEGYKSFPSGHTSWSFAGLGFLAWYLSGKIKAFDRRGHVAKLCIVFLPLLVAALVGVSRVDDYWHHWQDVFAGGLLGITIASFCYLQFFPLPYDIDGWGPHAYFQMLAESRDSVRLSSSANRNLNVQQAELQNVCIHPRHNLGFNTSDSSPMLDRLGSGWGQCH